MGSKPAVFLFWKEVARMATIDSLDIQIAGSAKKANDAIDSLITNLGRLADSLKIDTSGLEKIGKSLNFNGIRNGAKAISAQTKQISRTLESVSEKYKDLGKDFEPSDSLKKAQSQLSRYSDLFQKAKLDKESLEASGDVNTKGYDTAAKNFYRYGNVIENIKKKIEELNHTPVKLNLDFSQMSDEELDKALGFPNVSTWADKISQSTKEVAEDLRESAREFTGAWNGIELPNFDSDIKNLGDKLSQLKIPSIKEENLDKLRASLEKTESKLDELRSNLENGITMGRITESIDDSGYIKLQEQIAVTEKTATALRDRINEVSKASQGATGIKEVGKASDKASDSFSKLSKNTLKASISLKKMQSSLKGVLRAFLPILGIREFVRFGKESIKSSMNYLEILNYFDAAFGQVASKADLSAFEEMGYDSADAYYNSFARRAQELTAKMSGFTVGEGGLLQSTGAVSLGLDPSQLMNYQAMFGQMSSSMGVSSENALKLSQALTEIGADLASIKNMEFEDVWNDMASGLAGMSRTLDKYGVNIRNVNLQQKLNELGINANISALNQNNKALLRVIILLESTKYAWGDLADTINQPANQLRLIEANFQNLSRTIGNLFLPIVKTVLPYINALVIAVQRLFAWLGNLIGIDISDISTSIGSTDVSGFLDQTDDLADSLGGVAANAKKAKAGLRAFDELKTISMPEDSKGGASAGGIGGGLLDAAFNDAFSKYQQEWDRAFAGLENRAQEVADKIEKAFEPIKKIIQDFAIGDFFQAGKDTSALVASIFNFFAEAIDKVDWYGIGKKIGDFFAGIDWLSVLKSVGNLIWKALKAAFELYVGAFSSAPLETALVSLVAFPKLLKAITASKFIAGIGKLRKNFKVWGEKISLVTGALTGNEAAASGLYMLYPKLSKKVDGAKTAFSKFFSSVKTNGFWKTVDGGITNIRNNLGGLQKAAIVAVAGFAEFSVVSSSVEKLTLGTENWLAEIGKIAGVVAAAGAAMYVALGPAGLVMAAVTGLTAGIIGVENAMQHINAETIGNTIRNAFENPGGVSMDKIAGAFNEKMSSIAGSFDNVSQHSQALENAQENIKNTYGEISAIESAMNQGAISVEEGVKRINDAFAGLSTDFNDAITSLEQGIIGALGEGSVLRQYLAAMGYDVEALNGIVVGDVASIQKEFDKLAAEYESIKESTNPEDIARKEEIIQTMASISGVFDETTQNMTAFKTSVENMRLNMGSVIDTEGLNFKEEEFGNSLQSMVESYNAANDSISRGNETFQNNLATLSLMLEAAGIEENTETYSEIISKIPEITEMSDKDLQEAFIGIINTIQEDALNEIPALIKQAGEEWSNLDSETRVQLAYQGITNKDAYIASVLKSYEEDVLTPMENQINSALESLNIDENGIMVQKAQELYDSLFYYDYEWNLGGGERTFRMQENWEQILKEADLPSISAEYGETTVDSYNGAVQGAIAGSVSVAKQWMGDINKAIHDSEMDFGSPSKTAMQYGLDTVLGFNQGIIDNSIKTIDTISSYMDKIKKTFSGMASVFEEIGKMVMQGFESGMSQMEGGLYDKANSIANNITDTIKTALDIHSPSRVMFALGDYTMQGFKEGMESLYKPITDSVKAFGYDVAVVPAAMVDIRSGYQYQTMSYAPEYGITEHPQSGYNQSDPELKTLLKRNNELLSAILAKPNIDKGEIYNATKELYRRDGIRRYGNSAAFDPILGS